jgi:ATP-binding cassette subfamily C (CFTR/MRP) protein 1
MASMHTSDCSSVDHSFGPWAGPDCRGGFDFTLLFEEVFFSTVPLVLYLVAVSFRIFYLWNRQAKLLRSGLLYTKLVSNPAEARLYL